MEAEIYLFSDFGRNNEIRQGYRPNLVIGFLPESLPELWIGDQYYYSKQDSGSIKNMDVELNSDLIVFPGERAKVTFLVNLIRVHYVGDLLSVPGTAFLIREGARVVGTGIINAFQF